MQIINESNINDLEKLLLIIGEEQKNTLLFVSSSSKILDQLMRKQKDLESRFKSISDDMKILDVLREQAINVTACINSQSVCVMTMKFLRG